MTISARKRMAIKIISICVATYLGGSLAYFSFIYGVSWNGVYGAAFAVAINRAVLLQLANLEDVTNLNVKSELCAVGNINAGTAKIVNGYLGAREAASNCSVVEPLRTDGRCPLWWVGQRCAILEINDDVREKFSSQINAAIGDPCKYIPDDYLMMRRYGHSIGDSKYYSFICFPSIKWWLYRIEIV